MAAKKTTKMDKGGAKATAKKTPAKGGKKSVPAKAKAAKKAEGRMSQLDAAAKVLAEAEPFVLPQRNLSRGRRFLYMVQIGAGSRKEAVTLCNRLRADGGACIVQKN